MQHDKLTYKLIAQTFVTKKEAGLMAGFIILLVGWTWLCYVRAQSAAIGDLERLLGASFFDAFQRVSDLVEGSLAATNLFTSLVWALIGFLVYFIIWIVQSLALGTKQTVMFTVGYIHPPLFDIRKYFLFAAIERVVFGLLVFVVLLLGVLLTEVLVPTFTRVQLLILHGESFAERSHQLLGAVLAIVATAHLVVVCLRLTAGRYNRV